MSATQPLKIINIVDYISIIKFHYKWDLVKLYTAPYQSKFNVEHKEDQ